MITMTRELAWAAATDAAFTNMRNAGRLVWDIEDRSVAAVTFYRLWPEDCPENGNLAVVGRTA